jgi:ABC-2 type transport system ATP-binding protein
VKVRVINLKRHFGKTKAVDGISFSFESGQIYGFVGPNGAGKTTAMRILATMDEPTAGDAMLDGVSVVQEPEKARALVGFVPDSLPGHRDITVHEYIDFFARAYGIKGRKRLRVVGEIEEFTGLVTIRDKFINALSKGMKQRVSLARALVHDPPVMVLDEPAAGLDPRARIELRELLKALGERGKAMLISSHILTELAEICHGAVIIELGKILQSGPIEDLQNGFARRTTFVIRALSEQEQLCRCLLEMPQVSSARIAGNLVETEVSGGEEACSQLLASLVQDRQFRIVEFYQRQAGLEEVFMNVTKGKLQ